VPIESVFFTFLFPDMGGGSPPSLDSLLGYILIYCNWKTMTAISPATRILGH